MLVTIPLCPSSKTTFSIERFSMALVLAASAFAAAIIPFVILKHLGSSWNAPYFVLPVTELVLLTIYKAYIYPNFLSPLRHLPQPQGTLPLIGHDVALFQQPPAQDFSRWMRELENDGLVFLPTQHGSLNAVENIANVMVTPHRFVSAGSLGLIVFSSRIQRPLLKFWLRKLMTYRSHLLSANCAGSS
jgi:hypothetical protein